MTYQDVLNNARTCSGPYCKSCPVCNGVACNIVKGVMTVAGAQKL